MKTFIKGLHHVTAMAGDPQKNVDFYTGILGLRLVKKTVNFDAPDVYHLYYGNETGEAGSIMTFFPFHNMRPGSHGAGQTATTSFSVSKDSVTYWTERLDHFGISYEGPTERFDEVVIYFKDHDGLGLEIVANDHDKRLPFSYGQIPLAHAVKGFYNVELWEKHYELTESLMVNHMDYQFIGEEGARRRYSVAPEGQPGQIVDILWDRDKQFATNGSGTVHHIAFDIASDAEQLEIREQLLSAGYHVTDVKDRQYFHSIYFREPGGVLFEIATTPPGFLYDEDKAHLGEGLKLPPWEEHRRAYIEKLLTPVILHPENYASPY